LVVLIGRSTTDSVRSRPASDPATAALCAAWGAEGLLLRVC
jgi:hypothetical protein